MHHHRGNSLGRPEEITASRDLFERIWPGIRTLAELAVCGCSGRAAKTCPMVLDLITFWKKHQIFAAEQLDSLRDRVLPANDASWDDTLENLAANEENRTNGQRKQLQDDTRWVLPESHGVIGDPTAPWHELPAANGLLIKRTRGYPLRATALPPGGFRLRNGGMFCYQLSLMDNSDNSKARK